MGALVFGGIRALRPVYKLLILISPFLLFTFGQSGYKIATIRDDDRRMVPWRRALRPNPSASAASHLGVLRRVGPGFELFRKAVTDSIAGMDRLRANKFFGHRSHPATLRANRLVHLRRSTGIPVADIHPQ